MNGAHKPLKSIRLEAKPKRILQITDAKLLEQRQIYQRSDVSLIGATELGAEIGTALMHLGVGTLRIYDDTTVDAVTQTARRGKDAKPTDRYYAHRLAKRLVEEASAKSIIHGYPFPYDSVVAFPATVAIMSRWPDSRWPVYKEYFRATQTPFLVATIAADQSYGFVWVPACQPDESWEQLVAHRGSFANTAPWEHTGNAGNVLEQIAELVCTAVEELVMGCAVPWNFAEAYFTDQIHCRFYPREQPSEWSLTIDDYVDVAMAAA